MKMAFDIGRKSHKVSRRNPLQPGRRIIVLGCPSFDFIDSLNPSYGVGVSGSDRAIREMRSQCNNPNLHFSCGFEWLEMAKEPFDCLVIGPEATEVADTFHFLERIRPGLSDSAFVLYPRLSPLEFCAREFLRLITLGRWMGRFLTLTEERFQLALRSKGFRVDDVGTLSLGLNSQSPSFGCGGRFREYLCYEVTRLRREERDLPPSCSVIIPCHNEEDNIRECVRRVPALGDQMEIIVVDDGSRDGTAAVVEEMIPELGNLRLISSGTNEGKGRAVERGIAAAKNDLLLILDADMTVSPEDLVHFFDAIRWGIADFALGTRFVYPMESDSMGVFNYFGNLFFSRLVSRIAGFSCSDALCGTKVMYRKDFLDMELQDEKWGDFDLLFHAASKNLNCVEIPIHYKSRTAGISKMRSLSAGFRFLFQCLYTWKVAKTGKTKDLDNSAKCLTGG